MTTDFWLNDRQWSVIEPLLPRNRPGARRVDDRRVISGIIHVLRAGCRWEDCPSVYGPPTTVYNRFNRWSRRGLWRQLLEALVKADPGDTQMVDGTTARVQRRAAAKKGRTRPKRSNVHPKGGRGRMTPSPTSLGSRVSPRTVDSLYTAAMSTLDSMPGPTSRHYISQRLRMHYVDWGNPTAPTLLLVHGGRDHCRNWDWVAQALRRDWHVICPDLRGHGDSQWSPDGNYSMSAYIYDLAQLIHQQSLAPVTIVAHSLGGNICLRYTGIYPDKVRRLVAIEGLGPSPKVIAERGTKSMADRIAEWVDEQRKASGRLSRRYPTIEDAFARMQAENKHLSAEQARHLTVQGVNQNEDGTYSWKFDNYVRMNPPYDMSYGDIETLWARIACPTLLVYGKESWASNPEKDGRLEHFKTAKVVEFDGAGHWVHHDRLDAFVDTVRGFIA